MSYRLICTDMDGTLFNSQVVISRRNRAALEEASRRGIKVVLATGRLYNFAVAYTNYTRDNVIVISSNGAYVREKLSRRILYQRLLGENNAKNILEAFKSVGIPVTFFTPDTIIADKDCPVVMPYYGFDDIFIKKNNIKIRFVNEVGEWNSILKSNSDKILKAMVLEEDLDKLSKAKLELDKIASIEVTSARPNSFEIGALGVSKAAALKHIAKAYQINREDIICIGNGENDISMIEYAGLGVAMGNSHDALKEIADYVTDTNDNDGFAKAIEKFVL